MDSDRIREEMMRRAYLALLTGFVMTGCSGGTDQNSGESQRVTTEEKSRSVVPAQEVKYLVSPAGFGSVAPSEKAYSVYAAIMAGMAENDIVRLLEPVLLESGTEHGAASRRVYYCIGSNTQFWVEYQGGAQVGIATRKSGLEAKSLWRRYPAGSIEIAPLAVGQNERLADRNGVGTQ